ncbi:MAG: class III extradiol dioxygenase subunit B-like domain-containing protein [Sporichthyaceae bacterium]
MLVAAAVCPHPPLLVPQLAAGAAAELDRLRAACDVAVASLLAADADLLVVVGDAPRIGPFPGDAWGSLAPYGVDITVGEPPSQPRSCNGGSSGEPATLPLSLTIARWLLSRQDPPPIEPLLFGVSAGTDAARCASLGATLADREPRVAMLVMGDGSARRSVKGPGYLDERAAPYDETVARAMADADTAALVALDPALSAELLVAGRAAWQVLAGAAEGGSWSSAVTFDESPFGVTYLVATWRAGTA